MKPALRSAVLTVHRWAGLSVGVVAVFLALTGLTMAFRPQLEPVVDREFLDRPACEARLPLDELAVRARTAHPGKPVARIELPELRTAATIVRFSDREGIYLDACSGKVLGQRNPWGGFFPFMEMVHKLRFITEDGDVTEVIGGTIAILFASMVVGGVILAWPGTLRALKATLRPTLKPGTRAFDLMLHRSLGSCVFVVLLVSMAAALTFTFGWARTTINAVTGSSPPLRKPAAKSGGNALPLEHFLHRARALMPAMGMAIITLPKKPTEALEVYAIDRDAPHAYARSYAWFDAASGELLRFQPYAESSLGNKVYRWMSALHTARAGVIPQIVLFLGILAVPVMAFTGIRSYLARRRVPSRIQHGD